MILKELQNNNSDHLVIFFAGWSSHLDCFREFNIEGCDIWIVYDYRDLDLQLPATTKYSRISLLAWSFGVWAASYVRQLLPNISTTVAIAGSMLPIDDEYGINSKAFDITVHSIEKFGIGKFNKRMCGVNQKDFIASPRPIDELSEELRCLQQYSKDKKVDYSKWDYAVVCNKDLIFPAENLENFWKEYSTFAPIKIDQPHFMFNTEGVVLIERLIKRDI